jgi:hypothetical protein
VTADHETPESVARLYLGDDFDRLSAPQREGLLDLACALLNLDGQLRRIVDVQAEDDARRRDYDAARDQSRTARLRTLLAGGFRGSIDELVQVLGADDLNSVRCAVTRLRNAGDAAAAGTRPGRGGAHEIKGSARLLSEHRRQAHSNHLDAPRRTSPVSGRIALRRKTRSRVR